MGRTGNKGNDDGGEAASSLPAGLSGPQNSSNASKPISHDQIVGSPRHRTGIVERIRKTIRMSGRYDMSAQQPAVAGSHIHDSKSEVGVVGVNKEVYATIGSSTDDLSFKNEPWHKDCLGKQVGGIDLAALTKHAPRVSGRVSRSEFQESIEFVAFGMPDPGSGLERKVTVVASDGSGSYCKISDAIRDLSAAGGAYYNVIVVRQGVYHEHVTVPTNTAIIANGSVHSGKTTAMADIADDVEIVGPNVWEPVVKFAGTNSLVHGIRLRHRRRDEASGRRMVGFQRRTTDAQAAVVNQIGTRVLVDIAVGTVTARRGMVTKVNADNTCNVSFDNGETQKYIPLSRLQADIAAQKKENLQRRIEGYRRPRDPNDTTTKSAWTIAEEECISFHASKLSMVPVVCFASSCHTRSTPSSATTTPNNVDMTNTATLRRCQVGGLVTGRCLQVSGSAWPTITECLLEGGETRIENGAAPNIIDCYLTNPWGDAIRVAGLCAAIVRGCTVANCGRVGVCVTDGGHPTLERNHISNCGEGGVQVGARSTGTFRSNTLTQNKVFGACVSDRADPVFERNIFCLNNGVGILAMRGGRGKVSKNLFYANGAAAVHIASNSALRMTGNFVCGTLHRPTRQHLTHLNGGEGRQSTEPPDAVSVLEGLSLKTEVGIFMCGDGGSILRGNIIVAFKTACIACFGHPPSSHGSSGSTTSPDIASVKTTILDNMVATTCPASCFQVVNCSSAIEITQNSIRLAISGSRKISAHRKNDIAAHVAIKVSGPHTKSLSFRRNVITLAPNTETTSCMGISVTKGASISLSQCVMVGASSPQTRDAVVRTIGVQAYDCGTVGIANCSFLHLDVGIDVNDHVSVTIERSLFESPLAAGVLLCVRSDIATRPSTRSMFICAGNTFRGGCRHYIGIVGFAPESAADHNHCDRECRVDINNNLFERSFNGPNLCAIRVSDVILAPNSCLNITNNSIACAAIGIRLQRCSTKVMVPGSVALLANDLVGCSAIGVEVSDSLVTLANNRVYSGRIGVHVHGPKSRVRSETNVFAGNSNCGVVLSDGCGGTFDGDDISDNGKAFQISKPEVAGDSDAKLDIRNAAAGGVFLHGIATHAKLQSVLLSENGKPSALSCVAGASANLRSNCQVSHNNGNGIYVGRLSVADVHDSVIDGNTGWGLWADEKGKLHRASDALRSDVTSTRLSVVSSQCRHSGRGGICMDAAGELRSVIVTDNTEHGILVQLCQVNVECRKTRRVLVQNCTVTNNGKDGVRVLVCRASHAPVDSVTLSDCNIDNNMTIVPTPESEQKLLSTCVGQANTEELRGGISIVDDCECSCIGDDTSVVSVSSQTYMEKLAASVVANDSERSSDREANLSGTKEAAVVTCQKNLIRGHHTANIALGCSRSVSLSSNDVANSLGFGVLHVPPTCQTLNTTLEMSQNTVTQSAWTNVCLVCTGRGCCSTNFVGNTIREAQCCGVSIVLMPSDSGTTKNGCLIANNTISHNTQSNVEFISIETPRSYLEGDEAHSSCESGSILLDKNVIAHSTQGCGVLLNDSVVHSAGRGLYHGIYLTNNKITNNKRTGLALRLKNVDATSSPHGGGDTALKLIVAGNSFQEGTSTGIFMSGAVVAAGPLDDIPVPSSRTDNRKCSVLVTIRENVVAAHGASAIEVADNACPLVCGNAIHDNAGHGVNVYCGAGGQFSGNALFGNKRAAIQVSGSGAPVVSDNDMSSTAAEVVKLYGGANAELRSNCFRGGVPCTIAVQDGSNPVIEGNAIVCGTCNDGSSTKTNYGVHVSGESSCTARGNRFEGYLDSAIYVCDPSCSLIAEANYFPGQEHAVYDVTAATAGISNPDREKPTPAATSLAASVTNQQGSLAKRTPRACIFVAQAALVRIIANRLVRNASANCEGIVVKSTPKVDVSGNSVSGQGATAITVQVVSTAGGPTTLSTKWDLPNDVVVADNRIDNAVGDAIILCTSSAMSSTAVEWESEEPRIFVSSNTAVHGCARGVVVDDVPFGPLSVVDNAISECTLAGLYVAAQTNPMADIRIERNALRSNQGCGIDLIGTTAAVSTTVSEPGASLWKWWVVNNTFDDELGVGIRTTKNVSPRLAGNVLTGVHGAAIYVHDASCPSISANTIRRGQAEGISVNGASCVGVEICDNDITGCKSCGILVGDGASVDISRNRILDNTKGGVLIRAKAGGTITENEICRNHLSGIEVGGDGTAPEISKNKIFDGLQCGILVHDGAAGTIQANEVFANRLAGISVQSKAAPTVIENVVSKGLAGGIFVSENGGGTFISNDVFENAKAGIAVCEGSDPVFRKNKVHDNLQDGVYVYDDGKGTFEENIVRRNALAGVDISDGADPILRKNRIIDGGQGGVFIYAGAKGLLENNEICRNAKANVEIKDGANPTLRRNHIHSGKQDGIYIYENAAGVIEENEVSGNKLAGIAVRSGANPLMRGNKVFGGGDVGVLFYEAARGTLVGNDIHDNEKTNIDVRTGSVVVIKDNDISASQLYGIRFSDENSGGQVVDNNVHGNGKAGLLVLLGADPDVRGNRFHDGDSCGVVSWRWICEMWRFTCHLFVGFEILPLVPSVFGDDVLCFHAQRCFRCCWPTQKENTCTMSWKITSESS